MWPVLRGVLAQRGQHDMRFWNVQPRIVSGRKSLGRGVPSFVSMAVPAGGSCRGVKWGIPGAARLANLWVVLLFFFFFQLLLSNEK